MGKTSEHQARRLIAVLFLANAAFSTGMIATAAVNPILGARLGGSAALSGVPSAVYLVGSSGGAFLWGLIFARFGRRRSLTSAAGIGAAGAAVCILAVITGLFLPYLAGMLLIGSSLAAFQLSRFIAADINPPASRGRAIANVILGGAAGSIAGPLLTGPLSQAATSLGYDPLAGPFFAPLLLLAAAALLVFAGLRPAPETLAADVARRFPDASSSSSQPPRSPGQVFHQPAAALALAAMVISQVVMMSLMLITALHMNDHQHSLADISVVISSHTFGMFAFSVVSGRLADRLGRVPVILIGAAALSASGLLATVSPNVIPLAFALFLLGLGWNFCFVGASSLLADQLAPSERSRIQGINDMLLNGSSAAGSLATGLVYSSFGYFEIAFFSAGVSALLFMVLLVYRISQQQPRMAPE